MMTTRPPKTIVKPTALGPVANTDTKLLIYGLFQKGRVLAQDGVSTRNYERSLDKPAAKLKSRGTSKRAASRHLVSQATKKLEQYLSRRLEEYELAALMMDGLEVAGQTRRRNSRYHNRWNEGAPGYMAGLDGKLSGVHRDVAGPSRARLARR